MDFLKNLSLDNKDKNKHHSSSTMQDRGLFDTIGNALVNNAHVQGSQVPAQPTATSTTHSSKTEMLLGKLGEVLTDQPKKSSSSTSTTQQSQTHDYVGKISTALSGEKPQTHTAQKNEDNGLIGKVGSALLGKKEEPAKPEGLGGKLNSLLGGGASSEKNEDGLDKAIDFVQEHVLKQGSQHNESAIEQMKDKQIANAIRDQYQKFTGKEFPIKEKK